MIGYQLSYIEIYVNRLNFNFDDKSNMEVWILILQHIISQLTKKTWLV